MQRRWFWSLGREEIGVRVRKVDKNITNRGYRRPLGMSFYRREKCEIKRLMSYCYTFHELKLTPQLLVRSRILECSKNDQVVRGRSGSHLRICASGLGF